MKRLVAVAVLALGCSRRPAPTSTRGDDAEAARPAPAIAPGVVAPPSRSPAVAADIAAAPVLTSGPEVPAGTPYSRWEAAEQRQLLAANGVSDDRAAWRRAVEAGPPAVRAAACALLAAAPEAGDRAALNAALTAGDAAVRAWAALGLVRLGDDARRADLRALAARPIEFGDSSSLIAAAALARLGDARGLPAVQAAIEDADRRAEASRWLFDFARLPGVTVWPLYDRLLADPRPHVRELALMQLAELRDPGAVPALDAFAGGSGGDADQRARARALAASLRR